MKKAQYVLLSITLFFICILLGMFIGKNFCNTYISLSDHTENPSVCADDTTYESKTDSDGKININTATVSQLTMLPGIGDVIAQSIIDYRQNNGAFTTIEDLILVDGIGEKRLDEIRDYITVGG